MSPLLKTLALVLTCVAAAAPAWAGDEISVAETRLFLDNHLQNVRSATTIPYQFTQTGSDKDRYTDRVTLNVGAGAADKRALTVDFLSGARKLQLSSIEGGTGNPVILYFLEHDINEMHQRLKGQQAYFRKRIRLALADKATVRPVKLQLGGKAIDGTEVSIAPYADDPLKDRLQQFVSKTYVFTLSDAVPGGVYSMKTHVDASGAEPAIDTTLSLADARP